MVYETSRVLNWDGWWLCWATAGKAMSPSMWVFWDGVACSLGLALDLLCSWGWPSVSDPPTCWCRLLWPQNQLLRDDESHLEVSYRAWSSRADFPGHGLLVGARDYLSPKYDSTRGWFEVCISPLFCIPKTEGRTLKVASKISIFFFPSSDTDNLYATYGVTYSDIIMFQTQIFLYFHYYKITCCLSEPSLGGASPVCFS